MTSSLICAWIRLNSADRDDFLDFHDREHIPERLAVPGFKHGRRFVSTRDPNSFLLVYEVASTDVLTSPAYLERQNDPTDWTRRSIPLIRDPRRLAVRLELSLGQARGGCVALHHLDHPSEEQIAALETHASALMTRRGVLAVHLGRVDLAASNVNTVERRGLGSPDIPEGVVILVEATEASVAAQALEDLPPQNAQGRTETWSLQSSLGA